MEAEIITLALAAATIVKVLVDLVKMAWSVPQWLPPGLALAAGIGCVVLLLVASGNVIDVQLGSLAVLAGILAAGSAVGVTELQKRTLPGAD